MTYDENGNQDTLVVELLDPVWDADAGSVTYGVNILGDYEGDELAHAARQQSDEDLAATFGPASLFIDDCPDLTRCVRVSSISGAPFIPIGDLHGGPVGKCWSWSQFKCLPCNGTVHTVYWDQCDK